MANKSTFMCLAALLLLPALVSAETSLEQIFRPLQGIDVSQIYDHYASITDFFIYAAIFVGIAQATLSKRFPGRPGNAVSIAAGLSLAVAMSAASAKFGFSIKSFGPAAAAILILLFGIMVFRLLRYAGASKTAAAALTYIAVFLAVFVTAPEAVEWVTEHFPAAKALAAVSLLAALLILLAQISPSRIAKSVANQQTAKANKETKQSKQQKSEALSQEESLLKRWLKPRAKKEAQDTADLGGDLEELEKVIRQKSAEAPEARQAVIEQMRRAAQRVQEIGQQTQELKNLSQKIQALDKSVLTTNSQRRLQKMSKAEKALWQREVSSEMRRLDVDKKALRAEAEMQRLLVQVFECLKRAAERLAHRDKRGALKEIKAAVSADHALKQYARLLERLQDYLRALTECDIRTTARNP